MPPPPKSRPPATTTNADYPILIFPPATPRGAEPFSAVAITGRCRTKERIAHAGPANFPGPVRTPRKRMAPDARKRLGKPQTLRLHTAQIAMANTLPLRGRVGAKLRGGVNFCAKQRVTPTRRFAATSPLKGEVGLPLLPSGRSAERRRGDEGVFRQASHSVASHPALRATFSPAGRRGRMPRRLALSSCAFSPPSRLSQAWPGRRPSTLPLRGRVGAKLRGGVISRIRFKCEPFGFHQFALQKHHQIPRTRGSPPPSSISAVSAQTSASSRSGERPDDSPSGPKSHIWSSSAGNEPACTTRPCS